MLTTPPYRTRTCFLIFAFLLSFSSLTFGQEQSQYDKGTPPQHAAGVSSLGSYSSTEIGSVNLSNGALNSKIPLATIGGRGFSIPLTLNYSSKVWSASLDTALDNQSQPFQAAYADYAQGDSLSDFFQRVGPGWTVGAAPTIFNRIIRINKLPPNTPFGGCYTHTVAKLTVMLPDKGEIEFCDDRYDGEPLSSDCGGWSSISRGKRWHATDGSGTIYISDIDNAGAERFSDLSGVVITADGTRYRFNGPRCESITDRNGNQISINYTASPQKIEYKDQLGRITKIESFVADPDNPSVTLALLVTVPGYTGNNYIKVKRTAMRDNYRSDIATPSAVCNGTYDPLSKGYSSWCPGSSPVLLFPHSYGEFLQRIDDQQVVTEVVLPDQRSLRFKYNLFGEVAEAQLPTGGKVWYDYDEGTVPAGNSDAWEIGGGFHTEVGEVDRTLIQRRIFDGSTPLATWNYFYTASEALVTGLSPAGEVLLNQRHVFKPSGRYTDHIGGQGFHDGTYYNLWSTGLEWRTETRNADGTAVLSAVEKDWTQRAPVSWTSYQQQQPANDNRVNQERRYLETGLMAKVETFYDLYNNPIEVKEYDYDQTLKRRTVTSYVSSNIGFNYRTDDSIHLLSLPETQTVYDGAGNQRAQTVTEYDVYVNDTNHADLISYSSVSQHDSSYSASRKTRGNPTRVGNWLNTTASYIYTYPRYDFLGNVVTLKDARGNVSSISFADDFGDGSNPGTASQNPATPTYALPTLITSPPPVSGAAVHEARSQYNYATGLLTGFRDCNNVVTQTIYNDPLDRPTQVIAALGISNVQNRTLMYYAPGVTPFGVTLTNNDVLTARDQTLFTDSELRSWTVTDGFGRTKESWSRDPQGDVKVITTYDALGRAKQVSNPFRPSLLQTPEYSTTVYDLLGRLKTVSTPDGATVTNSYDANKVTVTDQAGKARKSVTDALGRLIEVYEDPNGVNYQTKYTYDVLDNLVKVEQDSQQRFFMYDSLKRLIRADNLEQETLGALSVTDPVTSHTNWTAKYEYDNNGNLTFKTDARGVVTENRYDALNRLTTVLYRINSQPDPNTGDIEYLYDNAANGKGRLWLTYRWGANPSHTAVGEYDATGRVKQLWNMFGDGVGGWPSGYGISRNYNLAGQVTSQTYPSGRTVNYSYDTAGRTTSFTGNLGDGVTRSYASSFLYNARSQVTQELFGTQTPLYHKLQYNVRGQLWDVRVSTNPDVNGSLNRGGFQFFYGSSLGYGTSGPDNNGNVLFANTYSPEDEQLNHWAISRQSYAYDSLNRLQSVTEYFANYSHPDSQPQSVQTYDYDRWGNRTINAAQTSGTGINNTVFEVESARNRLYSPGDLVPELPEEQKRIRYDKAGNQIKDTYTGNGTATFDGDNHIVAVQDKFGVSSTYTYNANAQRVRRRIDNQETWQIYGIDGELVAEYAAYSPVSAAQKEYGYRDGQLLIAAESSVVQSVSWTNAVGVSVNGKSLTKTAATGWGNAGATSAQSLTAGDGYTELTVPNTTTHRFVGLSNGNSNSDYTDVDFAIHPVIGGTIFIYEGGISRGTFGSYTAGDVLRVAVEGGVVKYRKNGALLYTSTIAPTYPLLVDSALHGTGNTLSNVVISGAAVTSTQSVSWQNVVGASVSGNTLTKTATTGWGNAGATSAQSLTTGDGYVDLTVPDTTAHRFVGFSNGNSNADYTDVDFAIHPVIGGTIFIYEGGVSRGTFGRYTAGDVLRVAVECGVVKYRKNGVLLYTSTIAPTYPLSVDSALYGTGDTLSNVVINSGAGGAAKVQWLVPDHLGTPRIILDQTGSLANLRRHDYLPFGEELPAGAGGRTPAMGYVAGDNVRQQFTAKERDNETGMDYFLARYHSSVQGRFSSPDEFQGDAYEFWLLDDSSASEKQALAYGDIEAPQSLNKYQYCYNNPLKFIDPNGHDALYVENKDTGQTTIVIPVHFTGPSATPALIAEVITRASQLNTGDPNVKIQIVSTNQKMHGVLNTMNLSPNADPKYPLGEGTKGRGGNKAHVKTNGVGGGGAIVHDSLHFAGLKDRYVEGKKDKNGNRTSKPMKGYDDTNIMAARGGTKLNSDQIKEAKDNGSTKRCTTQNGVTTCN
jgi:RHS repeat-associated protein